MRTRPMILLASAALLGWAQTNSLAQDWNARITDVKGEASVALAQGGEVPAEKDMPLAPGDRIRTAEGARVEIALEPESLFELGPGSEFEVGSLERKDSSFFLRVGQLMAKLRSMIATGGRLSVRTPLAVASVRGTEFAVDAPIQGGQARFGVFDEGTVAVSRDGEEVLLTPHQETESRRGAPLAARELRFFNTPEFKSRIERLRARRETLRGTWKTLAPRERPSREGRPRRDGRRSGRERPPRRSR